MTSPQKLTRNQSIVLDALREAGQPLSAYQVLDIEAVRAQGIKAPLTVYRAVGSLVERGLVHRIESLNAFVVCDHEPHGDAAAFMICTACKQTIEVGTSQVQNVMAKQAAAQGFKVDSMQIEISGTCGDCEG
ncbi:MAG: Fur family transcriptional regulator [Methyloligellaceae bacterium]